MLVAPYAYPRLLGAVALGLAAAVWLQRETQPSRIAPAAASLGAILASLGLLFVAAVDGVRYENVGDLVKIPAFAGVALLLYAAAAWIAAMPRKPLFLRISIVCGILAFPIFIGHGLVIPAKIALEATGWQPAAAIALPAIAFLYGMFWFGTRVYRMMFAVPKPS